MILAAPLVIPFAKAINLSIGTLGMAALADKVNDYIQDNPEESAMILKTLVPNLGIGEIFMSKESEDDVEVEDDGEEKKKSKKEIVLGELGKEKGNYSDPEAEGAYESKRGRIIRGLEDAGKIRKGPDPNYDPSKKFQGYKRFLKKADGGAIGVESLFEERVPAAPSQLVEESDMILGYRGPGGYQGGRSSRSGPSRGPAGGASAGGNYGGNRNPSQTYGGSIFGGGGGGPRPGTGSAGPAGGATRKITPTTQNFGLRALEFAKKYNPLNLLLGTDVAAAEIDFSKLPQAKDKFKPSFDVLGGSKLEKRYKGTTKKDFVDAIESGKFGVGGKSLFEENVGDLFEGVDLGKKGTFSFGDVSPTLIGTTDGSFRKTIDIDKEAIDPDDLKNLPGGFFKAEGGRVGFNVGGITDPAALSIYNSMNAYGFSDQEIADAITAQGYDAGTLGQGPSIPTPVPVAPEPGEGIIGIDVQQRDTGGGFNPFGPLDSTFTRDLTDMDMYKGVNVEGLTPVQQMNKYRTATQDNMFGLGKFFQPKIRGTLGNRLQKQFQTGQKLPSVLAKIAGTQSPFNIDSKNYNKDFVDQLNFLELGDDLIGMSGVGLKYGSGSVLAGKNVISGFGTNNYQKALEKFIRTTKSDKRKKQGELELKNFLNAEKARKEKEGRERQDMLEAAIRTRRDSGQSLSDIGRDMFTGRGQAFEKRSGGVSGKGTANERNYGGR